MTRWKKSQRRQGRPFRERVHPDEKAGPDKHGGFFRGAFQPRPFGHILYPPRYLAGLNVQPVRLVRGPPQPAPTAAQLKPAAADRTAISEQTARNLEIVDKAKNVGAAAVPALSTEELEKYASRIRPVARFEWRSEAPIRSSNNATALYYVEVREQDGRTLPIAQGIDEQCRAWFVKLHPLQSAEGLVELASVTTVHGANFGAFAPALRNTRANS